MHNSVVEALSEVAPAERYLHTNVIVPSGHVIGELLIRAVLVPAFHWFLGVVVSIRPVKLLYTEPGYHLDG